MPKAMEDALKKRAHKMNLSGKDFDRYVYGAMKNLGWKHGEALHPAENEQYDEIKKPPTDSLESKLSGTVGRVKEDSIPTPKDYMEDFQRGGTEEVLKKRGRNPKWEFRY